MSRDETARTGRLLRRRRSRRRRRFKRRPGEGTAGQAQGRRDARAPCATWAASPARTRSRAWRASTTTTSSSSSTDFKARKRTNDAGHHDQRVEHAERCRHRESGALSGWALGFDRSCVDARKLGKVPDWAEFSLQGMVHILQCRLRQRGCRAPRQDQGDKMRKTRMKAFAGLLLTLGCGLGAAQSIADLRNDAATPGDVTTYGMGWGQQRHTPLKSMTPANVKTPGTGMELQPGQLGECVEPAAADRRHDVHRQPHAHHGGRCRDRPAEVEDTDRGAGGRGRFPVLRHPLARAGGAGRRALPHHHRCPCRGHQHEGRQAGLEGQGGRLQAGLQHDPCTADRRRSAHHRHLWRRVRHARFHQRLGPEDRREEMDALHHGTAEREGRRHLEARHGRDWRRSDLADGHLRPRARPRLLGHGQWRAVESGHARWRLPLHLLGAGDPPLERRGRLALPVLAG